MGLKETVIYQSHAKILFAGCIAAAIFQFTNGSQNPNDPKIQTLKKELVVDKEKLKQTMEKTGNKAKFQEEVEHVSQTVRLALDYLPKELDIQDLYKKINAEARNAGVQISLFKPKETVSKDFYDEMPIEIALRGSYPQMVLFLSYVSKLPRIVNIRNVEMVEPVPLDGIPQMKLRGVLVAYRYKEGK